MEIMIQTIGWAGSFMVIAAYGLNSYQKITSDSLTFLLLNLIGGTFLIAFSIYVKAFPNTFINVVWVIMAIPALVKRLRRA